MSLREIGNGIRRMSGVISMGFGYMVGHALSYRGQCRNIEISLSEVYK